MLIGSRALNYWNPSFKLKEKCDWDIISEKPIPGSEHHEIDKYMSREFVDRYSTNDHVVFNGHSVPVCSLRGLAAIKRSHLSRDLFWDKHITHYHKYLSGFLFDDDEWELIKHREKITLKEANQKHPPLMKSNDEFFNDAVVKKFDHDWLHEIVAFDGKPMYTRLKKDFSVAWCEKEMWEKLSIEQKMICVAEEAHVIAAERFLIPSDWTKPYKLSYYLALKKVCTTLCSGWFRDFSIDNHPKICTLYSESTLEKVKQMTTEK